MKAIKIINDLLSSVSIALGLCVALQTGDPSQAIVAKGVVDALHAVGERIEKRTEEKPCEVSDKP